MFTIVSCLYFVDLLLQKTDIILGLALQPSLLRTFSPSRSVKIDGQ